MSSPLNFAVLWDIQNREQHREIDEHNKLPASNTILCQRFTCFSHPHFSSFVPRVKMKHCFGKAGRAARGAGDTRKEGSELKFPIPKLSYATMTKRDIAKGLTKTQVTGTHREGDRIRTLVSPVVVCCLHASLSHTLSHSRN